MVSLCTFSQMNNLHADASLKYLSAKTIDGCLTSGRFLRPHFFTIPITINIFCVPRVLLVGCSEPFCFSQMKNYE